MDGDGIDDYVFVQLDGKRYGLPAAAVREILQMLEPTPVPSWPANALGLMDIRGELIPLIDVAPLLGRPPLVISKDQFVVILVERSQPFGVVVDRVDGVRASRLTQPAELSAFQLLEAGTLCLGIIVDSDGPVVVLSPAELSEAVHGEAAA